ncbi:MAG: hypothetical protein LBV74_00860 [Tannerella sp.]|nr:hypothetical protein [Tannerella sp.]
MRSGKTQVAEGTLVNAIEDKAKELQEAEKRLETLTCTGGKTISASRFRARTDF